MTEPSPNTPAQAESRGSRRTMTGTVVSNKMAKTVVVEVERLYKHKKYGKYVRLYRKFKAHDENNACMVGDVVTITETRPMSKEKRWRVTGTLRKAIE